MKLLQELLTLSEGGFAGTKIVKGKAVYEAGRTFTIKNDNIKPRGAPEDKARAFDKVNPKTGARPDRSVLGPSATGNGKYVALEFADEVDFITVHVVRDDVELRDRAKDPNDNYEGIHVIFTPDGMISVDTYDVTSKRQWLKDKDKIVAVAKAALKDEHLSGQYDGMMGREVKRGKHKLSFDTDNHTIDTNKKMYRHRSDESQSSFLKKKPKQIDYKQAHKFAAEVGKLVKSKYRLDDGDDLCFNLVERGDIDMDAGADKAAQVVASRLTQR